MSKLWILALVAACTPAAGPSPAGPRPSAPAPLPSSPPPAPAPTPTPDPVPATPPVSGPYCGSRGTKPCEPPMFCNFEPRAQCGIGDMPGHCMKKPEACAQIYKPVCGCDGKTYGNACTANAAGTGVMSEGECPKRTP